jgi:Capsule assembly protein Wzi
MEGERPDVDQPLFMGMRFSFKPVSILELGLSRSAQFCGEGRPCDAETFFNVIFGRDNPGIRVDPAEEPGNQMAGFDARLVSPFKSLPLALYAELIGEDSSDTTIPMKYLAQFGAEGWWYTEAGSTWRARLEYANTGCNWYDPATRPDCAYRQNIFWAGYRYRGRAIGHTTDSDSETWMLQLLRTTAGGDRWGLVARHGTLDERGVPDPYNSVTYGPSDYDSLELSWNGLFLRQDFGVQLGYEHQDGANVDHAGAFGFIQWRKSL